MRLLRLFAALLALVALALPAHAGPTVNDVTVLIRNSTGCAGSGTCVGYDAIKSEAHILTCDHLWWEGIGTMNVKWPDGLTGTATILKRDQRNDLSALTVRIARQPKGWANLAKAEPRAGDRLFKVGYPLGRGPDLRTGAVAEAQGWSGENLMAHVPVCSGDSGGGLFNDKGDLVSVISGYSDRPKYFQGGQPVGGNFSRGAGYKALCSFARS